MFCPKCGTQLEDDLNFCTECGARLDEDAGELPAVKTAYAPPAGTASEKSGAFYNLVGWCFKTAFVVVVLLLLPATNYEIGIVVQYSLNSEAVRESDLMGLAIDLGAALTGLDDKDPGIVGQRVKMLTGKSYIPRYKIISKEVSYVLRKMRNNY
jgi:hypothetical protein